MPDVLAFVPLLAQSTAEEGRNIIIGMLLTGLVFVVIAVGGEMWHYFRHMRRR